MGAFNEINKNNHFPELKFCNVSANWFISSSDREDNTLSDITLEIESGQLLTVVGQIGSGKVSYG